MFDPDVVLETSGASMTATGQTNAEAFERLLIDAAQRDSRALAALNDLYLPRLTRFAASRGASDPEAVANQALFDGIQSIERIRSLEERVFRAYLFTSVINRVRNGHRAKRVSTVMLDPEWHGVDADLDPANLIASDGWFEEALNELLPDQQAVIVERFGRGSTIRETAATLGRSPDSVRHLQDRGLARIRRYVITAGLMALVLAAIFALARLGQGGTVSVEPVDQQEPPVGTDDQDPAPVDDQPDQPPGTEDQSQGPVDEAEELRATPAADVPAAAPASTVAPLAWFDCAVEDERCAVPRTNDVRFGAAGRYSYTTVSDGVECSNTVFGDPAPNIAKTCSYLDLSSRVALELVDTGRCVDISGTKMADLEGLMEWACEPGFSQHQWTLLRQADGSYLIQSMRSNRCMDVGGNKIDDGEPIVQNSCDASVTSQRWSFDALTVGDYRLRNLQSDKCVVSIVTGTTDGSPLAQWTCNTPGFGPRVALINVAS